MTKHFFKRGSITAVFAALTFVLAAPAIAQNTDEAKRKYKLAEAQYTLGNYERAAELFKDAYAEFPDPSILFNVAQSYRHAGKCDDALFFYRRFLLINPDAPNRRQVEEFIRDWEKHCNERQALQDRDPKGLSGDSIKDRRDPRPDTTARTTPADQPRPDTTTKTTPKPADTQVAALDDDDDDYYDDDYGSGGTVRKTATGRPTMLTSMVGIGPAFLGIGNLDVPTQFALDIGAGYPISFGDVSIDVGGLLSYTPVPWDNGAGVEGTASMTAILANVGANYHINDQVALRGEFGMGVLAFGGLKMGNVFTVAGAETTGALGMFNLRFGLGASYAVTPNILVGAMPVVFSYSPAAKDLREDIDSLTRFEMLFSVGYQM
jgi:hypothetical protein